MVAFLARTKSVSSPPGIFLEPDYDVFYKAGETVQMPCKATGEPKPTYYWNRNEIVFNPSGNGDRIVQLPDAGTLVINMTDPKDEGIFQCFAVNDFGRSASKKINLRQVKLLNFNYDKATTHRPQLGKPVTLPCVPPESFPPPSVFWITKTASGSINVINYDARVSMDGEYGLRITNVKAIDRNNNLPYACMATNDFLKSNVQGPLHYIDPQGVTEDYMPVSYLWADQEDRFGLLWSNFSVKCIFAGNPTPDVHWERTDNKTMSRRVNTKSFGQELMIKNLQFEDAGTYACWATNSVSEERLYRTFNIRINDKPYFLEAPKDIEVGVGASVEFTCIADGVPEPSIEWFVNGISLKDVRDPRITGPRFKHPVETKIFLENVELTDRMVFQCNASNLHGYVFADVFLYVISSRPPGILLEPDYDVFYKAGETVQMPCKATGEPKPTYYWNRNEIVFNLSGNDDRIVQLPDAGTLVINMPEDKDEGIFQCFAVNDYGRSASKKINLRQVKLLNFNYDKATTHRPQLGKPVTLPCVPPESVPPPSVFWITKTASGSINVINYDARVSMDREYGLRITNVKAIDRNKNSPYACMATNDFLISTVMGPYHYIDPQGVTEDYIPVSYLWADQDDRFGLLGSNFSMKCIFAGNPTPDVHWERTDNKTMSDRVYTKSFGQELMIKNLQFEDAGTYVYWATNSVSQERLYRTFNIRVNAKSYFLEAPKDIEVGVGASVEFTCIAGGVPEPSIEWFVNGISLKDVRDLRITGPRFKHPVETKIFFENVELTDHMVLQCNASNIHGYVFADVFLSVLCNFLASIFCFHNSGCALLANKYNKSRFIVIYKTSTLKSMVMMKRILDSPQPFMSEGVADIQLAEVWRRY
ncbi:hypothetical protein Btru_037521 [Bulinus truncatus]|nr:hypothetical protein Btru_037521 [Bulinus truncatus]